MHNPDARALLGMTDILTDPMGLVDAIHVVGGREPGRLGPLGQRHDVPARSPRPHASSALGMHGLAHSRGRGDAALVFRADDRPKAIGRILLADLVEMPISP